MHPWEVALVTYGLCVVINVVLSVAALVTYIYRRRSRRKNSPTFLQDSLFVLTALTFFVPPFGIVLPILLFISVQWEW